MFVKLHHVDSNFFPVLSSKKIKPFLELSIVHQIEKNQLPTIKKHRNQTPTRLLKRCVKINRNPLLDKKEAIAHKLKNRNEEQGTSNSGVEGKKNCPDGATKKVHTKCSTKCVRYGGCIPAILEALETVADLDEAFRPWQEKLSNKERTIILKEQPTWERAFKIFEWFKSKGCYEVNVIHYNIMLRVLGKAKQWSRVENLWTEMKKTGVKPITSTYGTLIDVYTKGGLIEKSLYWLNLMNEQGVGPDEVTMGIVVQMYKKAGEFDTAEHYFKKWSLASKHCTTKSAKGTTDVVNGDCQRLSSYSYNTLIDTYGKGGKLKDACETFSFMLKEKYIPTTVTFNTMIHIFGNNGKLDEVASLMKKMEQVGCLADTRTYNILISLHAKQDNIELAASYFKKMKESSLEPDHVSYRTLLYALSIRQMVVEVEEIVADMDEKGYEIDEFTQSALTRMYIEAGLIEKAFSWFKRFHLTGKMNSECYAANIDAFGERGYISEAEQVFDCSSCLEGKTMTVLEFNVMIKAYGISKMYDKAYSLFDIMEEYNKLVPDKCSYNSLIQMLASAGFAVKALSYARKMQEAGLMIDCVPYCAVISSFVKSGKLEMAVGVFQEMVRFNIDPDVVVYGVLINAFTEVGNVEKALGFVKEMRDSGISMNSVICNSLIKLYSKLGLLKEAQEAYKMMVKLLDTGPEMLYSSNCMIDMYSKRSMVEEAEEIFEKLKKKGDANEFSYAMMLCVYKRIGKLEKANRIAMKMRESGLLTELLTYNKVMGLYASEGRLKEAMTTFKEMMRCSINPDDSTIKWLGVILVKCGVPKQAVSKLEMKWKVDSKSGLKEWISTLDSVVKVFDD